MTWFPIRKTTTIVHVDYDHTTATLFAENIRVRPEDPFDISVDLNRSVRSRSKGVGTYIDARHLADGKLQTLRSIQIDEKQVLEELIRHLEHFERVPERWRLLVDLEGAFWFAVQPKLRGAHSLMLDVLSVDASIEEGRRG